jgi:hypothetical protein
LPVFKYRAAGITTISASKAQSKIVPGIHRTQAANSKLPRSLLLTIALALSDWTFLRASPLASALPAAGRWRLRGGRPPDLGLRGDRTGLRLRGHGPHFALRGNWTGLRLWGYGPDFALRSNRTGFGLRLRGLATFWLHSAKRWLSLLSAWLAAALAAWLSARHRAAAQRKGLSAAGLSSALLSSTSLATAAVNAPHRVHLSPRNRAAATLGAAVLGNRLVHLSSYGLPSTKPPPPAPPCPAGGTCRTMVRGGGAFCCIC